ncbi:helix-turn-helix domain-containing protein [Nostoc sp. TCL240-02]|uniref:helix-turn-helix domain-containing protein n=1 Tax=Nostoc sp. TCL240-02 TaxID=2572090 RepID=UPI00157F8205|nr:helix-turn-helix domain-containing protein [Nostoc sp. TCL240-02]QKQ75631.1 helix-turn-helix domain-containing protein [Nostoc sp. TCL240-02]
MDIKAAAEFLNISVKSIERLVKAKKIAVTYIEGKRNFSEEELVRFKEQKQEPVYRPALATTRNDAALSQPVAPEYLSSGLEHLEAISYHYAIAAIRLKMLLSLSEAAIISGLGKGFLVKQLKDGNLLGDKIGRGWKIRPSDLQKFVDDLF